ncbi:MAG: response regulator transcription factor [Desulfuromonadaceae bacterium]|jgi:DNA-binding NarL/FixJ family response regulator
MAIRILLADDHQIMRDGLIALFDKAKDIEVVAEAENGHETLEKTLELRPDVVVMDLNLPGISGIEATRRILAVDPGRRILALSMLQDQGCVVESLKAGVKGYLVKSCAAEELLQAIRALAAGGSYLCRQATQMVVKDVGHAEPKEPGVADHPVLTARELEVLRLIAAGQNTKEIAYQLGVSVKTIDVHRGRIMKKLNLYSIAELTKYAIREDLTSLE